MTHQGLGGPFTDVTTDGTDFDRFARDAKDRLWRALVPGFGPRVANEAAADAVIYAWKHWDRVSTLDNPVGYLYRLAHRSAVKLRDTSDPRVTELPLPEPNQLPHVEPGLIPALANLTEMQRTVVWLVEGCGWGLTETGSLLGVSVSTVRNHLARGLDHLRIALKVTADA